MRDIIYRDDALAIFSNIHPLDHNANAYKSKIEKIPSAPLPYGFLEFLFNTMNPNEMEKYISMYNSKNEKGM